MCKTEDNNNKPLNSNSIKTLNTIKMKKMKKSLLTLLTAILIGSSFTSCVENTIPDEVVAIYDGQANLLAAQAALLAAEANAANADAAMSAAMVAFQQSQTEAQNVANDYAQANNAILLAEAQAALSAQISFDAAALAEMEANLAIMIAAADTSNAAAIATLEAELAAAAVALATDQANLDNMVAVNATAQAAAQANLEAILAQAVINAANAQIALEVAQANHAINLEALANQLAQLDDDKIAEYFRLYTSYSNVLNSFRGAEVDAQLAIITKITDIALNAQNDEQVMAGFSNDIMIAQSAKADLEEQKATLEAAIAPGTSIGDNNAKKVMLQEEIDVIQTAIADLEIALFEMDVNVFNATNVVMNLQEELNLNGLEDEFIYAKASLNIAIGQKENFDADITTLSDNITTATAAIADYDTTTADLEADVEVKTSAAANATIAANAATMAADAAQNDLDTQTGALDDLKVAATFARDDVIIAAELWQIAIENAANSTTQARVEAAITAQVAAQAAYTIAKANFDDQSSQTTWGPGADGRLGIQSDDSNTAVATYQVITGINSSSNAEGTTYTATYGEATTTDPTTEDDYTDGVEVEEDEIDEDTKVGDYIEFGSDDVPTNDLEEFQFATGVLDSANVELDAANEANVDVTIAVTEAKAFYDEKANLFENAKELVSAQEEVVSAASGLATSTNSAANTATNVETNANIALMDAQGDLAEHEGTTVAMYETMIENDQVSILQLNIYITDVEEEIATIEAEIVVILAKLEAGKPAELIAAEAALIAAETEFMTGIATIEALDFSLMIKLMTMDMIGMEYDVILTSIEGIDTDIAVLDEQVATAEANIVAFPTLMIGERDSINAAQLAQLERALVTIQSNVVLYTALSAKYKALIDGSL